MNRPTSSFRDLIDMPAGGRKPAEAEPTAIEEMAADDSQPPPKKSDPLPKPGEPYRACARFLSRLGGDQRMIHFVKSNFDCEGFAYSDLRRVRWIASDDPGSGPVLVLVFVEAEVTEVRISGRNLDDIHYWISEGSMPWVWEQPKGFPTRDAAATVITDIRLTPIREK